jgi:hypothetical protein
MSIKFPLQPPDVDLIIKSLPPERLGQIMTDPELKAKNLDYPN